MNNVANIHHHNNGICPMPCAGVRWFKVYNSASWKDDYEGF